MERLEDVLKDLNMKHELANLDEFHSRLIQRYHSHRQFLKR